MKPHKEIQTEIKSEHQIVQSLKHLIFIFLLTFSVASCKNMGDPHTEILAYYNLGHSDLIQIGNGGEYLSDSLFVQIYNQLSVEDIANYRIEFEILTGGGSVDKTKLFTRKDGKAVTRWKLGKEKFKQTALAKIYNPDGIFLSQIQFTAYGSLPNAWHEVDFPPLSQVADLESDTINHVSWMISSGRIYKRGDNFMNWQLNSVNIKSPMEIKIAKNGVTYVSTWYGELFKTTDFGQNWIKCTNPIPNHFNRFNFFTTSEGYLRAKAPQDSVLWQSKDGGLTWSILQTDFIDGFKLKNGWIISHFDKPYNSIWKSEDDGKTWKMLPVTNYPYFVYVTANDEIIVCNQENGVSVYKSTDMGQSFTRIYNVKTIFGVGSMIRKYGSWYYLLIEGYGVLKTSDFKDFETIFNEPYIHALYIDHTGCIAVTGWLEKANRTFYYNKE